MTEREEDTGSGVVAGGGHAVNFGLSKNSSCWKCSAKNAKFGAKTHLFKFRCKIKILSTHNLLCRKFAAVCWKTSNSCPAYFLTHNANGQRGGRKRWGGTCLMLQQVKELTEAPACT